MSYPPVPNRPPASQMPAWQSVGPPAAPAAPAPRPDAAHPGLARVLVGAGIAIVAWQVLGYLPLLTPRTSDVSALVVISVVSSILQGIVSIGGLAIAATRWGLVPPAGGAVAVGLGLTYLANFAAPLTGLLGVACFVSLTSGLYLCAWMIVRGLPGRSYLAVLPAIALTFLALFLSYNTALLPGLLLQPLICLVVVGCAWLGRLLAAQGSRQPAPLASVSGLTVGPGPSTNALAIASLISVFFTTAGGLILGHMALADIRKTGEPGRGLALAAVIIGWTSTALAVIVIVVYFGTLASLLRRY